MPPRFPPVASFTDANTLEAVRPEVRELLLRVPAYAKLSRPEQQQLAQNMVKIAAYMVNPGGLLNGEAGPPPLARATAQDPVDATRARLARAPGQVGQDFQAGAVRQGVQQFGALVQKVNFPNFVGGLIKNVFEAIVSSSIEQMHAYGELLANVAKTVDEFAQDNISDNNGRDWLAGKYPAALGVQIGSSASAFDATAGAPPPQQTATLTTKGDNPEQDLTKISTDLGVNPPITDISDPDSEGKLVLAARLEMARSRQQLLASMVILGINRIVVTDGHIQAKVIFDVEASDEAQRQATASMLDTRAESASVSASGSFGGWFSPVSGSYSAAAATEHKTTVQSAVDDSSESKAQVKAQLSGEVKVNFKSDYFPMEKMASPEMIAAIQGRSVPTNQPPAAAAKA
jgi:hypothetical protein